MHYNQHTYNIDLLPSNIILNLSTKKNFKKNFRKNQKISNITSSLNFPTSHHGLRLHAGMVRSPEEHEEAHEDGRGGKEAQGTQSSRVEAHAGARRGGA